MIRDPHEPLERLSQFRSDPEDEKWLLALNESLASAELPPAPPAAVDASGLPLIYVVGAPRSGTTLLSQLLSRFLEVGYIDNLVARFWRRPSVGIRLSRILLGDGRRDGITFESQHGSTSGIAGPHEFGYFWRHWLRLDAQPTHHLDEAASRALDLSGLRIALEDEVLASFRRPVVFKNVICGFQAASLTTVHPRSLFVHVVRDEAATCASVLKSRFQRFGSYEAWWSLKPSTYAAIAALADSCEQVVRQVRDCRAETTAELERPGVRALTLDYELLCRDPRQAIRPIQDAVAAMGTQLEILDGVPDSFALSKGPLLTMDLQAGLRAALDRPVAKG